MAARHKNGPSALHNCRSDDTTSGTSGSTESEMHGSYNWRRGNDPPLQEVDMTALLSMRRSEESNANELQQRIRDLEAQIIACNKSRYGRISSYGQRGKNILRKSKHTLSTQDLINQGVVAAFLREAVWPRTKLLPRIGLNGGRKKTACARWYWKKYLYQWALMEGRTGNRCC